MHPPQRVDNPSEPFQSTVTEANLIEWEYARAVEQYWMEKRFGRLDCKQISMEHWLCGEEVYNEFGYKIFNVKDAVWYMNSYNYAKFVNWNNWIMRLTGQGE